MTMTPWGEAGALRENRLRPGPGVPREQVERNQRERLFGATVAATTAKGYGETTVTDLVEMAGVSRATFYRYFATKEECFLATLDTILDAAVAITASRVRRDQASWEEGAQHGLTTFIELIVGQPAGARLCLVEAYAAGPEAIARVDKALDRFHELVTFVLNQAPGRKGMPAEMTQAMVGSLRKIIHTRLYRRREGELVELVPQLLELGLSYRRPPRPLRAPRQRQAPVEPRPDQRPGPADRIERATMAVVAAKGYSETTITDIATKAATSLRTFYSHFDGKAEAFEAALYGTRLRMLAATLPVLRRAANWPEAIRAGIWASLSFFESEPDFARMIAVEVYAAGNEALARRDLAIESVQRSIEEGFKYAPQANPIAGEAIASSLYSMFSERVRSQGTENLLDLGPLAVYVTLAPFFGAEPACAVANGEDWSPSSP